MKFLKPFSCASSRFVFQFSESYDPSRFEKNDAPQADQERDPLSAEDLDSTFKAHIDSIKSVGDQFGESVPSLNDNQDLQEAQKNIQEIQNLIKKPGEDLLALVDGAEASEKTDSSQEKSNEMQTAKDLVEQKEYTGKDVQNGVNVLVEGGFTPEEINTSLEDAGFTQEKAEAYLSRASLFNSATVSILKNNPFLRKQHMEGFKIPEKEGGYNLINLENLHAEGERVALGYDKETGAFIDKDAPDVPLNGKKDFALLDDGSIYVGHKHVNLAGHEGVSMHLSFAGTVTFEDGKITSWDKDTGHFRTGGTENPYTKQSQKIDSLDDFKNLH